MQVAAYARVSSRRQAQAQTIEQQLDRLCAHASACGWLLAPEHVFRDDGYSGAKWFIRHMVSYDWDFSLVGEVPCVAQRFACAS